MSVSSKIRIYDLAKELKLDTKRLIEEVRREGVDVSVPSNSVSKELAEKIRNKYFPKKEAAVKRGVRVVKRAERATEELPPLETVEAAAEVAPVEETAPEAAPPEVTPPTPQPEVRTAATKILRKLAPAVRAEPPPAADAGAPAIATEPSPETEVTAVADTAELAPSEMVAETVAPAALPGHPRAPLRPAARPGSPSPPVPR